MVHEHVVGDVGYSEPDERGEHRAHQWSKGPGWLEDPLVGAVVDAEHEPLRLHDADDARRQDVHRAVAQHRPNAVPLAVGQQQRQGDDGEGDGKHDVQDGQVDLALEARPERALHAGKVDEELFALGVGDLIDLREVDQGPVKLPADVDGAGVGLLLGRRGGGGGHLSSRPGLA